MKSCLERLKDRSLNVNINDDSKIVLMSDVHRGDGSHSDNLLPNYPIYHAALRYYYKNGFTYVELGDGDELWENRRMSEISSTYSDVFEILSKFKKKNRIYMIYGNHDMVKRKWKVQNRRKKNRKALKKSRDFNSDIPYYECINFKYKNTDAFLAFHGHQADFFNNRLWMLSRFLVRYIWRVGEGILGLKAPTSPARNEEKKDKIDRILQKWSIDDNKMIITGHTHRARFPEEKGAAYFNTGCCVYPCAITSIEIENGEISLVKWYISTIEDGVLTVKSEVIGGPEPITKFIDYLEE